MNRAARLIATSGLVGLLGSPDCATRQPESSTLEENGPHLPVAGHAGVGPGPTSVGGDTARSASGGRASVSGGASAWPLSGGVSVIPPSGGASGMGLGVVGGAGAGGDATVLAKFSFFVTSLRALQELSGSLSGFGGDLRFGETGVGAGLRGADKICVAIAERSMPGCATKQWRAFLSATADENGLQVDAIDRIGEGPWYDRLGRLVAPTKADLIQIRPQNGDPTIMNDLPNERGVPNHDPDGTGQVDNHGTVTGSNAKGRLYGATSTCLDWTTAERVATTGRPRMGRSWPRNSYKGAEGSWVSAVDESGCGAGINLQDNGGAVPNLFTIGAGGGYGGFYCFALVQ